LVHSFSLSRGTAGNADVNMGIPCAAVKSR
jgi:hypothetical protein